MSRRQTGAAGTAVLLTASIGIAGSAHADDLYVKNTEDHGPGSLREAIEAANGSSGQDRILFSSRVSGTISLESDLTPLESAVAIKGPGRGRLTIDGNGKHQIFYVGESASVSGLTLEGGNRVAKPQPPVECSPPAMHCWVPYYAPLSGAIAIGEDGSVEVRGARFSGNSGDVAGAISGLDIGSVTISDSVFTGNDGVIDIDRASGEIRISDSVIRNNGPAYSAPIEISGGDLTIVDSDLVGNRHGAAKLISGSARIRNSRFVGNESVGGGAVNVLGGSVEISDSVFRGNENLVGGGGAIEIDAEGTSSIRSSAIVGNRSGTKELPGDDRRAGGGGINFNGWAPDSSLRLENVTVTGNRAIGGDGGGIQSRGELLLDSVTIAGNSVRKLKGGKAVRGGGLNVYQGVATIRNSIISGNSGQGTDDLSVLPLVPGHPPDTPPRFEISASLLGDTGGLAPAEFGDPSNIIGELPGLKPLGDNGGPTPTRLPRPSSPAVNRGSTELRTDQRGYPRRGRDDMGAVELRNAAFSFGGLKLNRAHGTATISVRASGPGRATLLRSGSVVGSAKPVGLSGKVGLVVRVRGESARRLFSRGRARVRARIRFESADGTRRIRSTSVKLVYPDAPT
ncbi:MAG TPA: choice-of-anchor Q domain-containing protein [Solirubrobacterales bacterium]|nr:choice-of-anchor Q domain-containing protein [Solirubrobacterales bacterium]